jgi:hypothetical protein
MGRSRRGVAEAVEGSRRQGRGSHGGLIGGAEMARAELPRHHHRIHKAGSCSSWRMGIWNIPFPTCLFILKPTFPSFVLLLVSFFVLY